MQVTLFEDHHWRNLLPMTLTRATFDVKVGSRTFFEEYAHAGRQPACLLVRGYLEKVTAERHGCKVNPASIDSDALFVNGLVHPATIDFARLESITHTFAITHRGRVLVARLAKKVAEYLARCVEAGKQADLKKLGAEKSTELKGDAEGVISDAWDIVRVLENSLAVQCAAQENSSSSGLNATVIGAASVVADGAEIEEGALLDARRGPIYIGPGASIAASRIVGPAYIGPEAQIKQFSIIESSYVGRKCRVAGEIEHSIISDYSNKAHAGFVGHSYVGEWVNMGAMTTTSDLKMTYGDIKMSGASGKKKVQTGLNKVGSFFGDMCKTSIGTLIYSGGRVGACSHLHGLVAGDVPAFTIYGKGAGARNVELELASAIETQRKVMPRRGQSMSKAYEQMIKDAFLMTAADRKTAGVRRAKFAL
jgi:UDP-N-acetylglucosamine diphosphorylase / glucose-1-phosphate thymidylyltransferase / UDP-N-acetylgalactosamine diphosphorylase / glucosamine-1-phosphate N-acetyltransferase / galactosamine-1-phosphate N-acetyltransferase